MTERDLLEDAINSTVLGSPVLVGEWDVLGQALGAPTLDGGPCESWFWLRLARAQPDALLRFGAVLLVVEAKYRARLRKAGGELPASERFPRRQLVQELLAWDGVEPPTRGSSDLPTHGDHRAPSVAIRTDARAYGLGP